MNIANNNLSKKGSSALIYFDNAVATKPFKSITQSIKSNLSDPWMDLNAPYFEKTHYFEIISQSLARIKGCLGVHSNDQLTLCSSGMSAVQKVYHKVYRDYISQSGKNQILTTDSEEAPIQLTSLEYEDIGLIRSTIPLDATGRVLVDKLERVISPKTCLISLSWANGLTGVIQPIAEISTLCREKGILLHVDGSHMLGKYECNISECMVDYFTFNGALFHAPKGCAGLITRSGLHDTSDEIESLKNANLSSLVCLADAMHSVSSNLDHMMLEINRLKKKLEEKIMENISGSEVLCQESERVPHITAIYFPGVVGELLAFHLYDKGVLSSFGGGALQKLCNLLYGVGINFQKSNSSLSFALSYATTEEEIEAGAKIIIEAFHKCRSFSKGLL